MSSEEKGFVVFLCVFATVILLGFGAGVGRILLGTHFERETLYERNVRFNGMEVSCSIVKQGGMK